MTDQYTRSTFTGLNKLYAITCDRLQPDSYLWPQHFYITCRMSYISLNCPRLLRIVSHEMGSIRGIYPPLVMRDEKTMCYYSDRIFDILSRR